MTDVNVNAQDLRMLAAALRSFQQEVNQASKRVRGALQKANWKDQRKVAFELRLSDLQKQLDGFMTGEVDQMVRTLTALAQKVEEISKMRM